MKLLIAGVPRSGTTIISNYINSAGNAFCFIEPHWSMRLYNRIDEFELLRNILYVDPYQLYERDASLPIHRLLDELEKKIQIVGFKETYRISKVAYKTNNDLIRSYVDSNQYRTLFILRHPYDVYNSVKRFDQSLQQLRDSFEEFIMGYLGFLDLLKGSSPIVFENFLTNPHGELTTALGMEVPKPEKIISYKTRMGDFDANNTEKLIKIKSVRVITDEDKKIIDHYSLVDLYQQVVRV